MAAAEIKRPLTKAMRQKLIDEFGRLQQAVNAHKRDKARHAEVREMLAGCYESATATQPFIEEGIEYTLSVSACANERTITNMARLLKMIGQRLFLKLCKFPLAAVDQTVPADEHPQFLKEGPTGPRTLSVIAKAPLLETAAR
jgi:hypothetical protein